MAKLAVFASHCGSGNILFHYIAPYKDIFNTHIEANTMTTPLIPNAKRQVVSIGKRKLTLDDFATILLGESVEIELNTAAEEQLRTDAAKAKKLFKDTPKEPNYEVKLDESKLLTPVQARAVMLVRISNFLQNLAHVRAEIVTFMIQLLNAYIAPLLPSELSESSFSYDRAVLSLVASAFDPESKLVCTQGINSTTRVVLGEFCKANSIEIPTLTDHERYRFLLGTIPTQALHLVNTLAVRNLIKLADAAAGLSCEAGYIPGATFTSDLYDFARPYATAMDAASVQRWMTEASNNVSKPRTGVYPRCYRYIPTAHAAIRDAATAAYNVARIDLNGSEAAGIGISPSIELSSDTIQINQAGVVLKNAMQEVMMYAFDRVKDILNTDSLVAPVIPPVVFSEADAKAPSDEEIAAAKARAGAIESVLRAQFAARLQNLTDEFKTQLQHNESADPLTVYKFVCCFQKTLALETAVALQVLGARDAITLTTSDLENAKVFAANRIKLAELEAEFANLSGALENLKSQNPPPADNDPKVKDLTKKVSVLQMRIERMRDNKLVAKGALYGKGTTAVREVLQPEYYPTYGVTEKTVTSGAEEKEITQYIEGLTQALTPLRPDWDKLSAHIQQAITTANAVVQAKVPKGTRDATPELMAIRERAFAIITEIFKRHGGVGIDTPVFERRDTLMGKYGEDSKLIYDLADQGGEILSLRYDLTVPFARYMATSGTTNIRRYHIAKVYRRDQPILTRGRFREFHQCDFDIAGVYPPMIPDAEILKIMSEVLTTLDLGPFMIKLNHRKLLDAMMAVAGVPADKFRPICSAIDKLDKEPWEAVKQEMVFEKGLPEEVADRLGAFVTRPAGEPLAMLAELEADTTINFNESAKQALADMKLLFKYLQAMNGLANISFDLSLARGLDYYTGIIYEAVLLSPNALGSIAAGGRYDNLIGMFSGKQVPSVGMSIGIERVMALMEQREREKGKIRTTNIDVLVASVGEYLMERMALCSELWARGIGAEFLYHEKPNLRKQIEHALSNDIPFVVWIGENELKENIVTLKRYTSSEDKEQHEDAITVPRDVLCDYLGHCIKLIKQNPTAKLPPVSALSRSVPEQ